MKRLLLLVCLVILTSYVSTIGQEYYIHRKEPAIALLCSQAIPGGGQLYNGQNGKGILMLGGAAFSYILAFTAGIETESVVIGNQLVDVRKSNAMLPIMLICGAGIHLWSVVDAPITAGKINRNPNYKLGIIPLKQDIGIGLCCRF